MQSVHGVTPELVSRIAGVGTVTVFTEVEGGPATVYFDEVYYVSGEEFGLFSPGLARDQGLNVSLEEATMISLYHMMEGV